MDTKRCIKCGEVKPLSEFYAMRGMRDGHRNDCKECSRAAKRERHRPQPRGEPRACAAVGRRQPRTACRVSSGVSKLAGAKGRHARPSTTGVRYGISADEVDEMLEAQNGGCAICKQPAPERLASMHLDHDHEPGQIRGFLCLDCNQALGKFRDDPALLLRAVVYLRQNQSPEALTG